MRERDAVTKASTAPVAEWKVALPDIAATEELGVFLAEQLRPGDLVTLSGGLGAGKTTLARTIVRTLADDPTLDVPSPTFTLMQTYETPAGLVVHADLYRLAGSGELRELGWDELAEQAIVLVEWPERASSVLKPSRLEVHLELASERRHEARVASFVARGEPAERFSRARALQQLLHRAGWGDCVRQPMQGDASTRAYERLVKPSGETAILMISPPRPDGPPVRRGKPYSAIAKLAESVHAFVALDRGLRALGCSAPRIYGEDLEAGLLILEDLGDELVVDADGPIFERYAEATRLLARLHTMNLPNALPITENADHVIPAYDMDALMIEADLLLDWYLPHIVGKSASGSVQGEFTHFWREVLSEIVAARTTWTLRDYHSPNLLWLADRDGLKRVGLLDFQDAVMGHPAYDLVSLLQDARVTVTADLEIKLLGVYARERAAADETFDMAAFARSYAILGAQRATKVLGIFARLDKRDGKPQYRAHMPRVEAYLARNLNHPALHRLRTWYQAHLPRLAAML
jgi:tRNA threonylcarbamoyl adenosine modification protein YjeE